MVKDKKKILKDVFGYDNFREGQEEIIDQILSGRDSVGIMPTGAGKSLCYQVPALALSGITIVVSPLISLMIDQVKSLNENGVHAAYINSALTESQIAKALLFAKEGRYKIIYVAPERLETAAFLDFVSNADISMITVDEAHCISQWGQDFRPSYRNIVKLYPKLKKRPVISAFTATATDIVQNDILEILELNRPFKIVTGYDRKNLYFEVRHANRKSLKDREIIEYIREHQGQSGIIYCSTKKNVDALYETLKEKGIAVGRYHAGLSNELRAMCQEKFLYDEIDVIIATNAFGMGIDKSNVRYVIHYNMPSCLENYYQEAGRAGRDGQDSECILLYSPQDVKIQEFLIEQKGKESELDEENLREVKKNDSKRLAAMKRYCFTKGCLRDYILNYFGEKSTGTSCNNCSICLGIKDPYEAINRADVSHLYNQDGSPSMPARAYASSNSYDEFSGSTDYYGIPFSVSRVAQKRTKSQDIMSLEDKEIFRALKELRLLIAKEEKVPPYIVFTDKTLTDMVRVKPENKAEMLLVEGVGIRKYDKYGIRFLNAIKKGRS